MDEFLLRNHKSADKLYSPLNPVYIGLHGRDGKGGRVAASGVPADYRGVLLHDSVVKENQGKLYEKLGSYVKSFDKQFLDVQDKLQAEGQSANAIRIKSLYLWSEAVGTGKTTTAVALLNEYLVKSYLGALRRGLSPSQRPVYFLDTNQLQTYYNEFNRPRVPEDIAERAARKYYQAIKKAKETEFVVMDDIGVRDATEGFRGDLHSAINHRVTHRLPTVYTSNVPISALSDVYGEDRLADRVRDMTMELHFKGESKRGMRK